MRKGGGSCLKFLSLSKQKVWTKHSDLFGNTCRELDETEQNEQPWQAASPRSSV